jgi:hypothetical protein
MKYIYFWNNIINKLILKDILITILYVKKLNHFFKSIKKQTNKYETVNK